MSPGPEPRAGDGPGTTASVHDLRAIAAAMRALSDRGAAGSDLPLQGLVEFALDLVPGVRWASVSTLHHGRFRTDAATAPEATRADALQYEIGSGPCVDSALEQSLNVIGDVETDPRWPAWGRRVAEAVGVRSVLAQRLQLHSDPQPIAALNLYSDEVDAFDDSAVGVALVLATHTAAVVSESLAQDRAHNLTRALESNRAIGVAMGILMEQHRLTRAEAFDVLRVASQDSNRKVSDIALDVADTGSLEIRRRPSRQVTRTTHTPPARKAPWA